MSESVNESVTAPVSESVGAPGSGMVGASSSGSVGQGIGGAPADQEDPRADLIWGTIPRLVDDAAIRHADTEALVDGGVRLTYAQLAPEVDRYARAFVAEGVATGDRVAIWAPNCAEWMIAALGVLRAGGVLVPLNTRFKGGEAAYILRNSGATTLITVRGFLGFDYPAMLEGEDVGALHTIVLLRDEPVADSNDASHSASPFVADSGDASPSAAPAAPHPPPPEGPPAPTP